MGRREAVPHNRSYVGVQCLASVRAAGPDAWHHASQEARTVHPAMKEVDESDEAVEFVTRAAQALEEQGTPRFLAIEQAAHLWMKSLERMRKKNQVEQDLIKKGKPTLHVGLFEAARLKETKKR